MTERENIDELAAEYALGSLSLQERGEVERRRAHEPELDRAIQVWENKLAPFLEAVEPVIPPAALFDRIRARISDQSSVISLSAHREKLAASTRPWRLATIGMTAVAASLAGLLFVTPLAKPPMTPKYVAVLQADAQAPAFLMSIDMKSHMCAIKSVVKPPSPDKSYQLWMVHDAFDQPKSLGLIAKNDMEMMPMAPDIDPDLYMNATFAVSLEPAGGSPTGTPTGPVRYAGRLVQSVP